MKPCLIYKITNLINGKVYIGRTWQSLEDRADDGYGYMGSVYLYNSIKKHGWKRFEMSLLTLTHTQSCADHWEKYFINHYDSQNREVGYNIRRGGK